MFGKELLQMDQCKHDVAKTKREQKQLRRQDKEIEKTERFVGKLGEKALKRAIRNYNKGKAMEGAVRFNRWKLVTGPHDELDRKFLEDGVSYKISEAHPGYQVINMNTEGTTYNVARVRFAFEYIPKVNSELEEVALSQPGEANNNFVIIPAEVSIPHK